MGITSSWRMIVEVVPGGNRDERKKEKRHDEKKKKKQHQRRRHGEKAPSIGVSCGGEVRRRGTAGLPDEEAAAAGASDDDDEDDDTNGVTRLPPVVVLCLSSWKGRADGVARVKLGDVHPLCGECGQ